MHFVFLQFLYFLNVVEIHLRNEGSEVFDGKGFDQVGKLKFCPKADALQRCTQTQILRLDQTLISGIADLANLLKTLKINSQKRIRKVFVF